MFLGQFGKVYKATLMLGSRVTVAVKTIRRYTSEKERQDFMREMAIMAEMMHPNIIQLYGLVNEGWQEPILTSLLSSPLPSFEVLEWEGLAMTVVLSLLLLKWLPPPHCRARRSCSLDGAGILTIRRPEELSQCKQFCIILPPM